MRVERRIAFLPDAAAAAFASALLAVLFAMYMPYTAMACGPFVRSKPDVREGQLFFDKPEMITIRISHDGQYGAGDRVVPPRDLPARIRELRAARPDLPLEIEADRRVPASSVFLAFAAARDAGYTEAWIFGYRRALAGDE